MFILSTQEYTWVPVRIEVDIVFEKASEALRNLRAVSSPGIWESCM